MPDPDYDDEPPKVDLPAAAPQPGSPDRGQGVSDGVSWLEPSASPAGPAPPAPPAGYLGAPPPTLVGPPAPAQGPPPDNGKATAALVLGIAGLALWAILGFGLVFVANLPCSILAWIFGVQGQRRVREGETTLGEGAAKAGVILGIIGVVLGVLGPAALLTVLFLA